MSQPKISSMSVERIGASKQNEELMADKSHAYRFCAEGPHPAQAAGVIEVHAGASPDSTGAVNPNGGATGIAQWTAAEDRRV